MERRTGKKGTTQKIREGVKRGREGFENHLRRKYVISFEPLQCLSSL